ncbi:molybdopterin molybdotransferase MoeA [Guyparkeria halophila]|uniref:Molybdopterin molybdenumtransferase n=1 Tax=Guyparkeria halophila TaxID=47960 RepID=A0ABZ0Z1N0_9GAMM|nr:molybdopterin molybdotransferase MoeA [Guyparkeria halophila]WQH17270.1 molybdopterin molybdotransferase MoeA [Guyparkeria halophila]
MTRCSCAIASPSVDEALAALIDTAPTLDTTEVALHAALGRTLARTIRAPRAYPPFNRAMMDGYAARHAELGDGNPGNAAALRVRPASDSDHSAPHPLPAGHCAAIATGAPLPPGADVVLRRERVNVSAGWLHVIEPASPWADCETVGAVAMPGAPILSSGTILTAGHLSLAARHGLATLPVRRAPRVAVLVTGDELIPPGEPCPPGSIHDSNSILLQATLTRLGAEVVGPAAPLADHLPTLEAAVRRQLADADVVCLIGGSSVGTRDFGRALLTRVGTTLFEGVSMRPGRPTSAAATPDGKLVIALPGRPAALLTALQVLVRPLLEAMQSSAAATPAPCARLVSPIGPMNAARYLPVRLECRDGTWWTLEQDVEAEYADALAVIPAHRTLDASTPVNLIALR